MIGVGEADEEPTADRDTGAADPGEEGGRLDGPHADGFAKTERCQPLLGVRRRIGLRTPLELLGPLLSARRASAEVLGSEQNQAVDGEERSRGRGVSEERAQLVLEEQANETCGDRADDEEPREPRVRIVVTDLAVPETSAEPLDDPCPFPEEEDEEHDRGREVRRHEEGEEIGLVLVQVPTEELRQDHGVTKARDREQLRHALQETDHDRLEVRDQMLAGCRYH